MTWSLTLAAIGVFGLWLAGRKNRWGWVVGFSAQILWVIYATVTHQYGFYISAIAYGWVYANNYLRWRKENETDNSVTEDSIYIGEEQR